MHYIGLDVHKKTIAFCIKLVDGQIVEQGTVSTNKKELATWANTLPPSCIIAIEAAKIAPMWNEQLAIVRSKEIERGADCNTATLEVARKLVSYLLAVDKSGRPFEYRELKKAA